MKLLLKFTIPVILLITLVGYIVLPLIDSFSNKWFEKDIELRSQLIASTLTENIVLNLSNNFIVKIEKNFLQAIQDERLFALGLCSDKNKFLVKTPSFPLEIGCFQKDSSSTLELPTGRIHLLAKPIHIENQSTPYTLMILHDLSFMEKRSKITQRYLIYLFAFLAIGISLLTLFIVRISIRGWLNSFQNLIHGEKLFSSQTPHEFKPFVKDLKKLIQNIERENRYKDDLQISWSSKAIKEILKKDLKGEEVLIVSNREPYIHVKTDSGIEVECPASGVVTALEPIMRACSGTWIAHGGGNADREVVDHKDRVPVPPGKPQYTLRRIWLTKEEEEGYYYGFANEGLWPLCHLAHVRPTFRASDWEYYKKVNQKFANAVVQESKSKDPIILVQDYHFALLPKMIKELLPEATIITFWHIPWPNQESFGICPWKEEILEGMLASSILGFHTTYHCNNFLNTVDQYLECRIDRATSSISYQGKKTEINPYPISIAPDENMHIYSEEDRSYFYKKLNIQPNVKIGIGIDRLDYTKGLIERFLSVEKFFSNNPQWINKFTFVQIAAPSRTSIDEYKIFTQKVLDLVDTINDKYQTANWKPIEFLHRHHKKDFISLAYQVSDLCLVSSLHDGMNLVAKEYLVQKENETGVLILSQFAGASMELLEAILVNPYDIASCADAIQIALEMPISEQKERMQSLRSNVKEFNVYRWAGRMLLDAARMRRREKILRTRVSDVTAL